MKRVAIISSVFFPFPHVGAVRVSNWAHQVHSDRLKRFALLSHTVPNDLVSGKVNAIGSPTDGWRVVSVVGVLRTEILKVLAESIALLMEKVPLRNDLEFRLIGPPLDQPESYCQLLGDRLVGGPATRASKVLWQRYCKAKEVA